MARVVIVQNWEESEAGWGVRPDGCSLHLSEAARLAFIKAYWETMPDYPPNEYSRPVGAPYSAEVDDEIFAEISASTNGIRRSVRPKRI